MSRFQIIVLVCGIAFSGQHAFAETCDQKIVALTFQCMGQNTNGTVAAAAACRKQAERQSNCGGDTESKALKPTVSLTLTGIDPSFQELSPTAESVVAKTGIVVDVAATEAKCVAVYQRSIGSLASARAFERFDEKYLGPLGNLITTIKIANLSKTGRTTEAAQETAGAVLDTIVCKAGGKICASWMVGKSLGGLMSDGPRIVGLSDRSLNDWWTDEVAEFMNSGPTEADFRRFEADARAKIVAAKAATQSKGGCPK